MHRWIVWLSLVSLSALSQAPVPSADLAWALHSEPKTYDPAKVDDQSSETIRYLTGGVLVRINRQTLQPEPALAELMQPPACIVPSIRPRPSAKSSSSLSP